MHFLHIANSDRPVAFYRHFCWLSCEVSARH